MWQVLANRKLTGISQLAMASCKASISDQIASTKQGTAAMSYSHFFSRPLKPEVEEAREGCDANQRESTSRANGAGGVGELGAVGAVRAADQQRLAERLAHLWWCVHTRGEEGAAHPDDSARDEDEGDEDAVVLRDFEAHRAARHHDEVGDDRRHGAGGEASDQPAAVVDREEERREHDGEDGHQLHQNVERGAGGVLERVAHRVAGDGRLVDV
mmetsp:Transcript_28123/g.68250  ORF Transcript_28123/g.68250 Transcript_28123/m.68250 type:complete len:214 (+) Transcript_28123:330-971(+)